MRVLLAAPVLLLLLAGLAGCNSPDGAGRNDGNATVLIATSIGDMTAEIYEDQAPRTAANFLTYVREGYYTDRQFYRIVPGFVSQGGGERQGDTGGHPPVVNEAKESGLHNLKYTISMARTSDPNSATTEFFINAADNTAGNRNNLDPGGVSAEGYAVFGIIVEGRDVADRLNAHTGAAPTFTITLDSSSSGSAGTTSQGPAAPCPDAPDQPRAAESGGVQLDLVTPGVWNVCAAKETMYAWVHNAGSSARDYSWSITGAGGAPLPEGWTVSFTTASGTLSPAGTKATAGGRTTYPDWAATRVSLTLPADQVAGNVSAELHAAGGVRPFTFVVHGLRPAVSGPGSTVNVQYDGRFEDDGSQFDDGEFQTTLGSGQTVPGFDNGLMGLALGETASLHIPPAFAYGYDNPAGNYQKFNGETLLFTVTIKSLR